MSKTTTPLQLSLSITVKDQNFVQDAELALPNPTSPVVPTVWGIPLKYLSLVILAVQNSTLTLIMHHSRVSTPPSRAYSAATAVLMNEIFKGLISLMIAYYRIDTSMMGNEVSQAHCTPGKVPFTRAVVFRLRRLQRDVFSQDCWKLSIPAILYVIQNNLQYVAASNLDAATFQVSYQMKILTTAAFSVILLRKKLSSTQWLALFCLALGVGVVQIQGPSHDSAQASISAGVRAMNSLKGFFAVVSACFTSGLAGVYFEMVLKNSQADLWVRNLQLSLFSLLPALAPIFLTQRTSISFVGNGLFSTLFVNFGIWAWATVFVQVLGGLVTAMVIKYSDNIMKGFATSLSIVISFLVSVALFDFQMTITFVLGSSIVLIATWLYNQPGRATSRVSLVTPSENLLKEKEYYYSPLLHSLTTVSSTPSLSSMTFSVPSSASDSGKTFFR